MNQYQVKIAVWAFLDRYLPFDSLRKLDLIRRIYFYKKNKAIFIHIPKAAGSSVAASLYGRRLGHHKSIDIQRDMPDLFGDLFTFGFVRNPWSRVYSSYNYAVNQGGTHGGIKNKPVYLSDKFSSFEKFVLEWLPAVDLDEEDPVFQPQVGYLYDSGELLVDYVGKVEFFNESLNEIKKMSGLLIRPIEINRSKAGGKSYMREYTPEMIDVVSMVYAEDVEKFNYSFDGNTK